MKTMQITVENTTYENIHKLRGIMSKRLKKPIKVGKIVDAVIGRYMELLAESEDIENRKA